MVTNSRVSSGFNGRQLSRRQTRTSANRAAVKLPLHQPTIAQSFANVQLKSVGASSRQEAGVYGEDLPPSAIDEFLDFGSQDGGSRDPPLPGEVFDLDATLPLTPQVYSSANDEEDEIRSSRKKQKIMSPHPAAHKNNTKCTSSIQYSSISSTLPKSASDSMVQSSKDTRTDSPESTYPVSASLAKSTRSKDLSLRRKRSQSIQLAFDDYFDRSVPVPPASEKERSSLCCSSEELFEDGLPAGDEGTKTLMRSDGNGKECTQKHELSLSDLVDACLFDLATPPLPSPKSSPRKLRSRSKGNEDVSLCDTDVRTLFDITNSPGKMSGIFPFQKSTHSEEGSDHSTTIQKLSSTASPDQGTDAVLPGTDDTPLQKVLARCDGQTDLNSYLTEEVAPSSSTASFADDVILISSGEDSPSEGSKSQEGEGREASRQKIKKKKKAFDFRKLFSKKRSIKELTREEVRRWLRQKRDLLVRLFERKEYSWRHEDYVAGAKKRASLQYQIDTRMFTQGQVDIITDCLMKVFCGRHMKFFSYTMSVLFPECLVRLIADFHNIEFDDADVMMRTYRNDREEVEISDDDLN